MWSSSSDACVGQVRQGHINHSFMKCYCSHISVPACQEILIVSHWKTNNKGGETHVRLRVIGVEGEAGMGVMLGDEGGGMERDIVVVFWFEDAGFKLDWQGGYPLIRLGVGA